MHTLVGRWQQSRMTDFGAEPLTPARPARNQVIKRTQSRTKDFGLCLRQGVADPLATGRLHGALTFAAPRVGPPIGGILSASEETDPPPLYQPGDDVLTDRRFLLCAMCLTDDRRHSRSPTTQMLASIAHSHTREHLREQCRGAESSPAPQASRS